MGGMIETEIIQDSGDYNAAGMVDEAAFNDVNLTDKQIEPSIRLSKYVTRNQIMGNIDDKKFTELEAIKDEAVSMISIPKSLGGWLSRQFAKNLLERNEMSLVMSGSRHGYARELLNTRKAVISKEERTSATKKKVGIGMGGD